MAQTDLEVYNLAIARAGGEPLDAIDNSTPLGAVGMLNYPQKRDWALGLTRWTWAKRVQQLAQAATPEVLPLPYVFALPSDLVGQVWAYRQSASIDQPTIRYEPAREGVATDYATTFAEYTARVDESRWPAWFTEFMVTALAGDVALQLQNMSLATAFRRTAVGSAFDERGEPGGLLLFAMQEDARNAPPRTLGGCDPGPLVAVRGNYWGSGLILLGPPTFLDPPV